MQLCFVFKHSPLLKSGWLSLRVFLPRFVRVAGSAQSFRVVLRFLFLWGCSYRSREALCKLMSRGGPRIVGRIRQSAQTCGVWPGCHPARQSRISDRSPSRPRLPLRKSHPCAPSPPRNRTPASGRSRDQVLIPPRKRSGPTGNCLLGLRTHLDAPTQSADIHYRICPGPTLSGGLFSLGQRRLGWLLPASLRSSDADTLFRLCARSCLSGLRRGLRTRLP